MHINIIKNIINIISTDYICTASVKYGPFDLMGALDYSSVQQPAMDHKGGVLDFLRKNISQVCWNSKIILLPPVGNSFEYINTNESEEVELGFLSFYSKLPFFLDKHLQIDYYNNLSQVYVGEKLIKTLKDMPTMLDIDKLLNLLTVYRFINFHMYKMDDFSRFKHINTLIGNLLDTFNKRFEYSCCLYQSNSSFPIQTINKYDYMDITVFNYNDLFTSFTNNNIYCIRIVIDKKQDNNKKDYSNLSSEFICIPRTYTFIFSNSLEDLLFIDGELINDGRVNGIQGGYDVLANILERLSSIQPITELKWTISDFTWDTSIKLEDF